MYDHNIPEEIIERIKGRGWCTQDALKRTREQENDQRRREREREKERGREREREKSAAPARGHDFRIDGLGPPIVNAEATRGIHRHLQHRTVPHSEIVAATFFLGRRLKNKRLKSWIHLQWKHVGITKYT